MTESPNVVSAARRIPAPASRIFAVLADPRRHPEIDGSGMVKCALTTQPVAGVGDVFVMAMHNAEMGDYEMTSQVVEYEPDRTIAWEPVLTAATREEDKDGIGEPAHYRWSYTLTPDGENVTVVTETYDCTDAPAWLQKVVKGGQRWLPTMEVTLQRIEDVTSSTPTPSGDR
ncbi:MAG TPA: SRPBCC family protein [Acidimicrobiales bacterium]|jgi:uncharacterized protein YndB with AHSA1/START domain|nr:SRPBCC family protein [Acidimicrobiales bacterium]